MAEKLIITYKGNSLTIEPKKIAKGFMYLVSLLEGGHLMAISKAEREDHTQFWACIPDGKFKEAQEIGKLIDNHFEKNKIGSVHFVQMTLFP